LAGFRLPVSTIPLLAFVLVFVGCGFRLNDDELLSRALQAGEQHDYRAAVIDLKAILQRDPQNIDARVALGRVYLTVNEPYAAEKELRKAVELGTPVSAVVVSLGKALLSQGEFELLLAEIEEGLADSDSDRLSLKLLRGDAKLALGQPEQARDLYTEVLTIDRNNAVAYLGMASTFLAEGRPEQAGASLDRAIEVGGNLAQAWVARGTFRLNQRMPAAAETDFQTALELARVGQEAGVQQTALAGLTDIHLINGDTSAAASSAKMLEAISPGSMVSRYTLARVAFATQDIDRAVELLQSILKDSPEFRQAHLLFGAVNRAKGNLAQAEMYLASVVAAWPENTEARKLLADVRLRLSKPIEAAQSIEPLLAEESEDDQLLAVAGVIKLQAGDYEEGLELFRRSVEADPENQERMVDLATIYVAVGQTAKAVSILESLAGSDVDQDRRDVLTIISLRRQESVDAAIRKARELLALAPNNEQLLAVLGGMFQDSGNLPAARDSFEKAILLDRANIASQLGLARIDAAEGRYADARLRYRRALEIEPENVLIINEMAQISSLEGDTASAVSWLEKARFVNDSAIAPRIQLATYYLSQQRYDEALLVSEEAVRIDSTNARALNVLGVSQMVKGNYTAAKENFAAAIGFGPSVIAYRYNRARADLEQGSSPAAWKAIRSIYEANPEHLPTATYLANYYVRNKEYSAATDIARRLQQILPNRSAGLALEGDILVAMGEPSKAVELYESALAVEQSRALAIRAYRLRLRTSSPRPFKPIREYVDSNPEDSIARMFLAESYQTSGQADAAAVEYERLLESNPDNVVAMNNLAWILLANGSPRAVEVAASAYQMTPGNGAIADTYGWILLQYGKSDQAVKILREASELMPNNIEISYHLGAALFQTGRTGEAHDVLEEIATSDESFEGRETALKMFEELLAGT